MLCMVWGQETSRARDYGIDYLSDQKKEHNQQIQGKLTRVG